MDEITQFLRLAWVALAVLGSAMQIIWLLDSLRDRRALGRQQNGRRLIVSWQQRQVVYRLTTMVLLLIAGITSAWGAALGIPIDLRALPVILAIDASLVVGLVASVVLYIYKARILRDL